jgi:hypothetical protein
LITNKEISEFLIDKLSISTSLETYSQSQFSKSPLIFLGIDTENPPHTTDYPLLAIAPMTNEMSDSNTNYDYEMVIHLMINGSENPTTNGNVIKYEGIYKIEEMGNIVVEELKSAFNCTNLDSYEITFYNHEITLFPIYSGAIVINFSVPNIIGNDKLSLLGE